MAALIVLTATIVAIAVVLFGAFVWTCIGIRRTDKFGTRRPGRRTRRRMPSLAYVARWDDNRPAFA